MIPILGLIIAILIFKFLPRPKKIWFKAKPYGYGWYASSWQGWLITLSIAAAGVLSFLYYDTDKLSTIDTLMNFIPILSDLILILLAIAYRTGDKLAWRWGNKK